MDTHGIIFSRESRHSMKYYHQMVVFKAGRIRQLPRQNEAYHHRQCAGFQPFWRRPFLQPLCRRQHACHLATMWGVNQTFVFSVLLPSSLQCKWRTGCHLCFCQPILKDKTQSHAHFKHQKKKKIKEERTYIRHAEHPRSSVLQLEVFIVEFTSVNRLTTSSIMICEVSTLDTSFQQKGTTTKKWKHQTWSMKSLITRWNVHPLKWRALPLLPRPFSPEWELLL